MSKRGFWGIVLTLFLAGTLLLGCQAGQDPAVDEPTATAEAQELPVQDPGTPFSLGDQVQVALTNAQAYNLIVQRDNGEPLFGMAFKKTGVIDPSVDFSVQTFPFEMPEDLAQTYVPVGEYAFELHALDEPGYGFSLRPELTIHFTAEEIAAAKEAGAALEPLKGNLLILYKEQRSPKWVPQTSISVDEQAGSVLVSNIAGAGAWTLVAKKAP